MKGVWSGLPPPWDLPGWMRAVFSRREHPVLQFVRYGIAGVAAMMANLGFFVACELFVFPVPEVTMEPVEVGWGRPGEWLRLFREDLRVANFIRCNVVAFLAANVVAYVLNFLWVFRSGRHSRGTEITLFFVVSLFSFVLGTLLASVWVNHGADEYLAKSADVVTAVLVNYLCRKFLVFQG